VSAIERIGAGALDRVIFGGTPEKALDEMTVEELEARFRIVRERRALLWWGGFAAGFGGGAFGGFKLAALATALSARRS
jgi:hypothetical protein